MISKGQAKLIRKLRSRKQRDERLQFLVEGIRLGEELLRSGLPVELAVLAPSLRTSARGRRLAAEIAARDLTVAELPDRELKRLADTESPQGLLMVAQRPRHRLAEFEPGPGGPVLVLDRLQDPGNAGTLVRVAEALGVVWVVALPGCVDPWNPKAVRAAAGSLFRLPVSQEPWPEVRSWLQRHGFRIMCADPGGHAIARRTESLKRFALVLGNEPGGLSAEVETDCDQSVAVRLPLGMDSLNVAIAGAILLDRLQGDAFLDER